MIHDKGNQIINHLEKSIGKFSLPQILRWIAGFQAMTWALSLFSPEFLEWIVFDRDAVMAGQVWRLFTWFLYPASDFVLFVLIALLFMFFINDSLEGHWGNFRLNLYVFSTILCLSIAGMFPVASGAGLIMNSVFYSAVFLAFAGLFPNHVIHLFAIIPIKAKWLGWANGAVLIAMVVTSNAPIIVGGIVFLGLIPFGLTFIPTFISSFKEQGEAAVRRHRFEGTQQPDDEAFHVCESCGASDKTQPERDFRVTADGRELCENCRVDSRDSE